MVTLIPACSSEQMHLKERMKEEFFLRKDKCVQCSEDEIVQYVNNTGFAFTYRTTVLLRHLH